MEDESEDANDGVVDAHVVDLHVLDMGQGQGERVVLDVENLVDEDNAAAEDHICLPDVGQVGIKNVQKSLVIGGLAFL